MKKTLEQVENDSLDLQQVVANSVYDSNGEYEGIEIIVPETDTFAGFQEVIKTKNIDRFNEVLELLADKGAKIAKG